MPMICKRTCAARWRESPVIRSRENPRSTGGDVMLDPLPELWGPEHSDLVDRLVPDHGPANTVQGEVLRAALRVNAEFFRNGCGNWPADPEFFDGLVAFLLVHLCEGTFDTAT